MTLSIPASEAKRPVTIFVIYLFVFGLSVLLMELPVLDPTGFNRFQTGTFLSVLWCLGLVSWALRVVRSRQSQFSLRTILGVATSVAVILALGQTGSWHAAVLTVLVISCVAMVFDLGVRQTDGVRLSTTALRTLQVLAGLTGLAHVARLAFYMLLA